MRWHLHSTCASIPAVNAVYPLFYINKYCYWLFLFGVDVFVLGIGGTVVVGI